MKRKNDKSKNLHFLIAKINYLVLPLFLLLLSIPGITQLQAHAATQGSITLDTTSTAQQKYGTTSVSWSHTVGNFSNKLLVVGVAVNGGKVVSSISFGSTSLTKLDRISYGGAHQDNEFWYLRNPSVGTKTITVKLSGSTNVVAGSASFYNVDQGITFGKDAKASGDGRTATVTVPSGSNEMVLSILGSDTINGAFLPTSGQTQLWNGYTNTPQNGASSKSSAGTSTAMTWTDWATDNWAVIGVSLLPAVVTTPTPTPTAAPTPLPTATPTPTPTATPTPLPTATPTPTPTSVPVPNATLFGAAGTFGQLASQSALPTGQSLQTVGVSNWGFNPGESEFFAALGFDGQVILATDPQTDNESYPTANQMNVGVFNPVANNFSTIAIPTSTGYTSATDPWTTPPNIVGGADIGQIVPVDNTIVGVSDVPYFDWDQTTYGEYPSFFTLQSVNGQWVYNASASATADSIYAQSSVGQLACPKRTDLLGITISACGFGEINVLPNNQYLIATNYFPDSSKNEHSGRITALTTGGTVLDVFTYPDIIPNASGSSLTVSPRSVVVDPNTHTDPITGDSLSYFIILFDATDSNGTIQTTPIQLFSFDTTTHKITPISEPIFTGQKDSNGNFYRMAVTRFDTNGNIWVTQNVYNSLAGGPTVVYTKKSDGTTSLESTCKQTGSWSTWNQTCAPDITISGSENYGSPWNFTEDTSNNMMYETTLSGDLLRYQQSGSGTTFSASMLSPIDIGLGYLRTNGRQIGIRNAIVDQSGRALWIPVYQTQPSGFCSNWPCTPTVLEQWLYRFDLNALSH